MHSENVFNFFGGHSHVPLKCWLEIGKILYHYREKQNKTELDISGSPFFSYYYDFVLGWELEKSQSLDSF